MDLSDAKKILEKGRKILLKTGPWRLILICLCGILIVALSSGTGEKKTVLQEESTGENQIKNQWQQELSTVLSKMEGVGKCQVVVSVSEDEKNNYHPDGVVVVCEGAGDPAVKREIISVAQALFSVESHKIEIMNHRR